jgi:CubicO group peptidase (beta-lactamase class C family)
VTLRWLTALGSLLCAVPVLAQTAPPAARVRVTFDRNRVTSVRALGLADRSTGRAVTADDPVRMASISKLVVALAVMRLVEAGTLDLDRDVSSWLGWRLRNPAFPDVPITLRLLLSHQSSLTDGADYLVPLGEKLEARLGNATAWDSVNAPGRYFRYSNINFPVIGSVIERATGERFDQVMMRTVFRPLKIDACYNWSGCSADKIAHAVVLHDITGPVRRDDLKGKPPSCLVYAAPGGDCDLSSYHIGDNGALFSPQGGMRISARDLAKIGQLLLRGGNGFLKPASFATMITPQWRFNGNNGDSEGGFFCAYGLAVQTLTTAAEPCKDDPFGDRRMRFGHAGEAYGLRSGLWVDRKSGKGVAFFVSAVADDEPKGASAFTQAEEAQLRDLPDRLRK